MIAEEKLNPNEIINNGKEVIRIEAEAIADLQTQHKRRFCKCS